MSSIRPFILSLLFAVCSGGAALAQSGGGWQLLQHQQSAFANFELGASVAGVGDLDGDLIPDNLQASPGSNSNGLTANGKVQIRSGADGSQIDRVLGAATDDRLGAAVANAGDVSGDGVDDFLAGAPFHDGGAADGGAVYLYDGATRAVLQTWLGTDVGGHFGAAVSGGVDLTGDGKPDVVIGAPDAEVGGLSGAGRVFVYDGVTGALVRSHDGAEMDGHLGAAVLLLPDVTGDLLGDYVLGIPGSDLGPGAFSGAIEAFDGATGASRFTRSGGTDAAEFGAALARIADRDGDGFDEFAVGAPNAEGPFAVAYGAVRVYLGDTGDFHKQYLPPDTDSRYGAAVARAGDVDRDGVDDLVVGAPDGDSASLTDCGTLWFVSGATGYHNMVAQGDSDAARMGASVTKAGNLDEDRRPEILAGSPGFQAGALAAAGATDLYGIDPWMVADVESISASAGGTVQFELDFPASFGNKAYEIFASAAGTGPTIRGGIKIPLTVDFLFRRLHNVPPSSWTGHDGVLDAAGDAASVLPFGPGYLAVAVGRTVWFAAVALNGNSPLGASMPTPVTIEP